MHVREKQMRSLNDHAACQWVILQYFLQLLLSDNENVDVRFRTNGKRLTHLQVIITFSSKRLTKVDWIVVEWTKLVVYWKFTPLSTVVNNKNGLELPDEN